MDTADELRVLCRALRKSADPPAPLGLALGMVLED